MIAQKRNSISRLGDSLSASRKLRQLHSAQIT